MMLKRAESLYNISKDHPLNITVEIHNVDIVGVHLGHILNIGWE